MEKVCNDQQLQVSVVKTNYGEDKKKINECDDVIVQADKTSQFMK